MKVDTKEISTPVDQEGFTSVTQPARNWESSNMAILPQLTSHSGGDDWKTLYFTSQNQLASVKVNIPGNPVPAVPKIRWLLC
ncbi:MAG: hypothetical protein CM1200mP22_32560 [Dehalococcoidia bacterium]|nr:MAG: hypothetical protein CM1200mP22_32560 [Dehalococcoidia bacterium]